MVFWFLTLLLLLVFCWHICKGTIEFTVLQAKMGTYCQKGLFSQVADWHIVMENRKTEPDKPDIMQIWNRNSTIMGNIIIIITACIMTLFEKTIYKRYVVLVEHLF